MKLLPIPSVGHLPLAGKQVSVDIGYSAPATLSSLYSGYLRSSLEQRLDRRGATVFRDQGDGRQPDISLTVHISHHKREPTWLERIIWRKDLIKDGLVQFKLACEWTSHERKGGVTLVDRSEEMKTNSPAKKVIASIEASFPTV